jgi:hypothetical protein
MFLRASFHLFHIGALTLLKRISLPPYLSTFEGAQPARITLKCKAGTVATLFIRSILNGQGGCL